MVARHSEKHGAVPAGHIQPALAAAVAPCRAPLQRRVAAARLRRLFPLLRGGLQIHQGSSPLLLRARWERAPSEQTQAQKEARTPSFQVWCHAAASHTWAGKV